MVETTVESRGMRKKSLWRRLKPTFRAWLYIAPAGLLMLVITFFPQMFQVWMSFTDYRITNLRFNLFNPDTWNQFAPTVVGLRNFVRVLTSDLAIENYNFGRLLTFNIVWTVANLVFHVTMGIVIALVLNSKDLIGRRIYRALFVLPWALPGLIVAFTWRNMFDVQFGAINQLIGVFNQLTGLHLDTTIRWLESSQAPIGGPLSFLPLAFYAVLLTNIWLGWPFMTVIATGALQAIPEDLFEAADLDGASGWQKIWNVTLPLIRPAMVPAIMVGTIWTFQ